MIGSSISWCDDTVNPWWGCTKVSPACTNCYAESLDKRWHAADPHWGRNAPRMLRVEKAIAELEASARRAVKEGVKRRVFIASMADIFEDREDLVEPRSFFLGALDGIQERHGSPLVPLLLTKRPDVALLFAQQCPWPRGAMLGVTVENQEQADKRIPVALQVAARTGCRAFLSMEPLLEAVNLRLDWFNDTGRWDSTGRPLPLRRVSWVIAGGESGHGARPMHPEWARSLRDQCVSAGVPFHFKQSGEWVEVPPADGVAGDRWALPAPLGLVPYIEGDGQWYMAPLMRRVGKKAAGRLLDGRTWDEVPQ